MDNSGISPLIAQKRVCCKIMVLQQTLWLGQSLRHGLRRATSLYTREAFGLERANRNTAVPRPPCVKGAVTVGDWGIVSGGELGNLRFLQQALFGWFGDGETWNYSSSPSMEMERTSSSSTPSWVSSTSSVWGSSASRAAWAAALTASKRLSSWGISSSILSYLR